MLFLLILLLNNDIFLYILLYMYCFMCIICYKIIYKYMIIMKFLLNNMVKNNRLFNWINICNFLRNGKVLFE